MSCVPWGCWTATAVPHPWAPILDVACGYDHRLVDSRCAGCHRSRDEGPREQLEALHGLGDAAEEQCERAIPKCRPTTTEDLEGNNQSGATTAETGQM